MRNKAELLAISENIQRYFSENGMSNVLDIVIELGRTATKTEIQEDKQKQKFFNLVWHLKDQKEFLGGGNAVKESYIKFVTGYLNLLVRFNKPECHNREIARLDMDELMYVFAWATRLLKDNEFKQKNNKRQIDRNDHSHTYKNNQRNGRKYR